jgi:predicted permease
MGADLRGLKIDAKAVVRGLTRRPLLLVAAVLCLALGIGANATMLRVLDQLFFRPPALVARPEELRRLSFFLVIPDAGQFTSSATGYPELGDLRAASKSLSHLAAYMATDALVGSGDAARKVRATILSRDFFELLGVRPVQGRTFSPAENRETAGSPVALVSEGFWKDYYGGRPDVLGQPLRIGSDVYTIIGVMPRRFTGVELEPVDVWLPLHATSSFLGIRWNQNRGSGFLHVIARLRPGADSRAAEQELTNLYLSGYKEAGDPRPDSRVALGLIQAAWGPGNKTSVQVSLWLAAVSFAVLLIACANVASLLIVRSLQARRERSIRLALGAARSRLVSLTLLEGLILAVLGGLGALLVMVWSGASFAAFLLPGIPVEDFVNFHTAGSLTLLILITGLLCGLVPALWESRRDPIDVLKDAEGESGQGLRRTRAALVTAQVALTFLLLVGTGLFVRSLQNINHMALGLDPERVLVATVKLQSKDHSATQARDLYRQALQRVARIPGVENASLSATVPFLNSMAIPLKVPGRQELPSLPSGGPYVNAVSEEFFATLGTAVRLGRVFTAQDQAGGAPVAVVNESFARYVWPGGQAVGQCLVVGGPEAPCSRVVGVVQDARRARIDEPATLQVYVPLAQAPTMLPPQALLVRVHGDPARWVGAIRREIQALAPAAPWIDVQKLDDSLKRQVQPWKLGATLFSVFGGLALFLAAIGIYASISFDLLQRQHEMGVRLALGASWGNLLRHGMRGAATVVAVGATAGIVCVLFFGDFIQPLLLGVRAMDLPVLLGAVLCVAGTAAVAAYLPARRLRRVDPVAALRLE